jgi:L-rhamnose-H+ transport protein
MSVDIWIGLAMALVAGAMAGNCMLPSKYVHRWSWENMWLVFSLVSLVVLPWALALLTVPHLGELYAGLPARQFLVPFLLGAGWGIAQVLFGLSIARLGLALGYAIIVGLGAMLGTLVPLVLQQRSLLGTGRGVSILCGIAVMVLGIVVAGIAGRQREAATHKPAVALARSGYGAAVLLAVVCGLMAPMINYSLAFGQDIANAAMRLGTSPSNAAYAVWPVGLAGGLFPNLAYSIYLLNRNQTWFKFREMRPDVFWSMLMAVLWMGAIAVYGMSAAFLGALGTSVGWALFQIFMIMSANLSGVITHEWSGTPLRVRGLLAMGLGLLAVATVMMALGNCGAKSS